MVGWSGRRLTTFERSVIRFVALFCLFFLGGSFEIWLLQWCFGNLVKDSSPLGRSFFSFMMGLMLQLNLLVPFFS